MMLVDCLNIWNAKRRLSHGSGVTLESAKSHIHDCICRLSWPVHVRSRSQFIEINHLIFSAANFSPCSMKPTTRSNKQTKYRPLYKQCHPLLQLSIRSGRCALALRVSSRFSSVGPDLAQILLIACVSRSRLVQRTFAQS